MDHRVDLSRAKALNRYGNKYLDFAYDVLKLIWGHPLSRIPKLLIIAGLSMMASPWWLPILYELLSSTLGINISFILEFDNKLFASGCILVALGVVLWCYVIRKLRTTSFGEAFKNWERLKHRLQDRLEKQLTYASYDASFDVRSHQVPRDFVTVLCGESGQGKTWRLAGIATHALQEGRLPIWVSGKRTAKDVATTISTTLWNYGLEEDSSVAIDVIARKRREFCPKGPLPWAVACVDDIASFEDACQLTAMAWQEWGIAVVLCTPLEMGKRLQRRELADLEELKDFSVDELRSFLTSHDKQHLSIARDVEQLIRRPILAAAYVQSNPSSEWQPENEYAVLDRYWHSIDDSHEKALLQNLADTLLDDNAEYPWRVSTLNSLGIASEDIRFLASSGKLSFIEDSCVEFWHFRLLAWAYADALSRARVAQRLDTQQVADKLAVCLDEQMPSNRPRLQYAAMDTMWMICGQENTDQWKLITTLDQATKFLHYNENFYKGMLATLGTRVVPSIVDRVRESGEQEGNQIPRHCAAAVREIGKNNSKYVSTIANDNLQGDQRAILEFGLRLAADFPDRISVDRIWEIHLARVLRVKKDKSAFSELRLSQNAFRSVVSRNLQWLEERLVYHQNDADALVELTYTLANLENAEITSIWERSKVLLFDKIPIDRRRCLAVTIFRCRDSSELDRLESWVTEETDWIGSTSFQVLCFFDANRAAGLLNRLPAKVVALNANAIGLSLFAADPKVALDSITPIVSETAEDIWLYLLMLRGVGDQIDDDLAELVLEHLERELSSYAELTRDCVNNQLWRPLSIVESLHGDTCLQRLQAKRGTRFEELLTEFAIIRADNSSGWFDREYDFAKQLLKRIAGQGFTLLTNALLSAEARQSRLEGCEHSVISQNSATFDLLSRATLDDRLWEGSGKPYPIVQSYGITSLAALGRDRDLVTAVMKWGEEISPEVPKLCSQRAPMDDKAIEPALNALKDQRHSRHTNAIIAVGLSGRKELIPQILEEFELAACDSKVAFASMLALRDFEFVDVCMAERLAKQWHSGHHKFAALQLLLEKPSVWLEGYLLELVPSGRKYDDMDERLLSYLKEQDATREQAIDRLRQFYEKTNGGITWRFLDTNCILDPNDPDDFEELWDRCRLPEGVFVPNSSQVAALLKLSEKDSKLAYDLAIESLLSSQDASRSILDALFRIDSSRATVDACRAAISSRHRLFCRAVGIALRSYAVNDIAQKWVVDALSMPDWRARRSSAMLAGYLGTTDVWQALKSTVGRDHNWAVCVESQRALRRLQKETEAKRLVSSLREMAPEELWGYLDCLVQLVDPDFLTMESDPLGISDFFDNAPLHVTLYADKLVKEQRKKVEEEMKSLHGRWERDE